MIGWLKKLTAKDRGFVSQLDDEVYDAVISAAAERGPKHVHAALELLLVSPFPQLRERAVVEVAMLTLRSTELWKFEKAEPAESEMPEEFSARAEPLAHTGLDEQGDKMLGRPV